MERKPKQIFIQGAISSSKIADSIQKHSSKTDIGAHSIFLGQVRTDEKPEGIIQAIEYTTYEEMALQKAFEIREDIFAKYPLTCLHIYHSLGVVKTGEICLFVFTSSKNRKAATEACNEMVERIKNELPVWGKEIIDEKKSLWKENS
ncbi:MAG TPA: molybdenum cofactor biosynthesis protein MoaE [Bacteroidia bacterium]|nr:molybdenum cofactor biosynthesis protein MoaE [Bacteroidia bacterium]QQR95085.1 MAG: molybdenum cofactor biosynthesis protein MoaE [Bacteroidota bacterium]MBP7714317.1 molybdenum cofactor biosynthesis protein MoaE [Bacteroidia bacterium]MBP8669321.1 molybdenum cofactor biosynthesis protein MoaE [Bacteroidia bacterium]HOZ82152.1 molybdenum cofactor biosynthesis protein MoaE [Bacteroidia bacterium]